MYTVELREGEPGLRIKELSIIHGHKMLKIVHQTWLQVDVPGVSSIDQRLENPLRDSVVSRAKGPIELR